MSYQVLARKWRPKSFQEMVGQEHILRMLSNALSLQRLHHAYLFTGTRGVGKTSLARLLAKCLNCETGITATPCNICTTCQAVDAGRFLDLIEIDAASRTKVEDTREVLDNVQYAPTQGRYKIYLIDEVHMLSGHSFNALLKTLEEPPAHVKFLLATTDPKRLPITVLSRCLQFNLKRVLPEQIAKQLHHICQEEKIESEKIALDELASAADGSMRDALSLLDQAITYCGAHITTVEVRKMLGSIEEEYFYRILKAISANNGKALLDELKALHEYAPDYDQALENLLSILHQISIAQVIASDNDTKPAIQELAQTLSPEDAQLYYQIGMMGRRDLNYAPTPANGFEMTLLRMLAFKPMTTETPPVNKAPTYHAATPTIPAAAKPAPAATSQPAAVPSQNGPWQDLLDKMQLTGMTQLLASNCTLEKITEHSVELALTAKQGPLFNQKISDRLEEALSKQLGKTIKLQIKLTDKELNTVAKQQIEEKKVQQANAVDAITSDDHVQKIINMFDATLDVDSIKAI